jgi:hypothetical protein
MLRSAAGTYRESWMHKNRSLVHCNDQAANIPSAGARILPVLVLLASLAGATSASAAGFDAEIAYTHDDNITRGSQELDILDDNKLSVRAGVVFPQAAGTNGRLLYRGFLQAEKYDQWEGLDNTALGVSVTYQYRPSAEFLAATYAGFVKAAEIDYDSELRDGRETRAGVSVQKPLTDRIALFVQLASNRHDADNDVFDSSEDSLLLNLDYQLTSRALLYLSANRLKGDIVSTVTWTTGSTWSYPVWAWDDVFPGWASYRFSARTQVWTLGINYMLNENNSIDLSARAADSEADWGITYERRLYTLAYLARF